MRSPIKFGAVALAIFLTLFFQAIAPSFASSQCKPSAVWAVFPDSAELATAGVINDKLKTESGPTPNKEGIEIYSRRWTGSSSSRGVSITLTFYSSALLANQKVRGFGLKPDGSLAPDIRKLSFGDEGYAILGGAAGMFRPVYMIQIKNLVVFYYSSYPRRTTVKDQTAIVKNICAKAARLPCLTSGAKPPPPPPPPKANTCPKYKLGLSPSKPVAGQQVIITGEAVDPDGDQVDISWRVLNYQKQLESSFPKRTGRVSGKGKTSLRLVWPKAPGGRYYIKWIISDGVCSKNATSDFSVSAPGRVNRSPKITLSFTPPNPQKGQLVKVSGRIWDPDGDAVKYNWIDGYTKGYARISVGPSSKKGDLRVFWQANLNAGLRKVCLKGYDSFGGRASKCVDILVNDPKAPLTVKLTSDKTRAVLGQGFSFQAVANNPAKARLTYQWSINGKKTSWQGSKAVWPKPPAGSHLVEVLVSQWGGGAVRDALRLRVDPAPAASNQKPVIQSLALLTPNPREGNPVSFQVKAKDPDPGDSLSYAWSLDGAPLRASGGRAVWTKATAGPHRVKVIVSDGKDRTGRELGFKIQAKPSLLVSKAILSENTPPQGGSSQDTFLIGQAIYLWLEGSSTGSPAGLRVLWTSPQGKILKTDRPKTPPNGRWNLASTFKTDSSCPLGSWRVEVYLGGTKLRELKFNLVKEKVLRLFSKSDNQCRQLP